MINSGFMRYLDKLADEYGDGAEGDTMRRAAATIRALESELSTLKAQREWVSVGEKLPSSAMSQRVLVYSPERGVEHGYWSGDYFHGECDDVTHWLPLPPAPEGE